MISTSNVIYLGFCLKLVITVSYSQRRHIYVFNIITKKNNRIRTVKVACKLFLEKVKLLGDSNCFIVLNIYNSS